jgi:hypothetical protein
MNDIRCPCAGELHHNEQTTMAADVTVSVSNRGLRLSRFDANVLREVRVLPAAVAGKPIW